MNCGGCAATPAVSDSPQLRMLVATWNVGGTRPHGEMDLDHILLPPDDRSDIYVLGFQEIVPLNAGNVLVLEDNEPAVEWLHLINQSLNKPPSDFRSNCYSTTLLESCSSSSKLPVSKSTISNLSILFFQKHSLKAISKSFSTEKGRRLKTCNCHIKVEKFHEDTCFKGPWSYSNEECSSFREHEGSSAYMVTDAFSTRPATAQQRYALVACKQMVGIFVTIWVREELVQHISHLRIASVGRGIMGRLGNKGCISVSLSLYQTSFCFVCSHLASGEKEGDERRRNADVTKILKNTRFPRICKSSCRKIPGKILDHDRVIWLGDLNYRIALSYTETQKLLQDNDWRSLLEKDQLKIERKAGRVFKEWNEGNIYFAPTYKYSSNSDAYAGETVKSKKNRTPAWCDRILWHGNGIEQLSYIRGESRFSDHRPVSAIFKVEAELVDMTLKTGLSAPNMKEHLPSRSRC